MYNKKKHIIILYTDCGGGHRATADALKTVLERDVTIRVSTTNVYTGIIPNLDGFRFTPFGGEEIYNRFIQGKGWTGVFALLFYGIVIGSIRLQWRKGRRQLETYWQTEKPDMVISVLPLINTLLSRSLKHFSIPFMVVMTDLREPQKFVWLPRDQTTTVVCGSREAYEDARKKPHPPSRIYRTSGLAVNPRFYETRERDIASARKEHGLEAGLPTGCISYGGSGSTRMAELARSLNSWDRDAAFQMIFLCGRHKDTADTIRNLKLPFPHLILGYTTEVPYYMRLADFFVGKPGPGSLSEALVMGLPVILDRKNPLLQEKHNIRWIEQERLGLSFQSTKGFQESMAKMLDTGNREGMVERISQIDNRAIFQLPGIVREILSRGADEREGRTYNGTFLGN